MFTIIKPGTAIDFVGRRQYAFIVSGILVALSVALLLVSGPRYGIDFAGGTLVHVRFKGPIEISAIRGALADVGGDVSVQDFGGAAAAGEFLLRVPQSASDLAGFGARIEKALAATFGADAYEVLRTEAVGPRVGKELRRKGVLAVLVATFMMGAYIAIRFQLRFGVGAAVALAHDVLVTVGALILMNYEFDLTIIAALLTVIGFSVNDTVIISDRIRENMRRVRRQPLADIINLSINETLSRTVLTAGTTLLVIMALFVFGGSVIHGFAFALLVGVTVGTYSSIFVASPIVLAFERSSGSSARARTAA
jgi:preprotein translocase subunit SecF